MVVDHLLGDVDTNSMDTSNHLFDDVMSCTEYDTPCQILGDDSKKVLDGS